MPVTFPTAINLKTYGARSSRMVSVPGKFVCDDIPLTARAILGILNWTITWYRPNGPLTVTQIADHYSNLLLNGLMK